MSFLGRWFGNVVGKWWGPTSVEPDIVTDTHDGFWHREWLKLHKKKAPTIAEIVEAVQENPVQAVAQAKAIPQVVAKYPEVSLEAVKQNLALQRFIARQILEMMQEEDDLEALLLL